MHWKQTIVAGAVALVVSGCASFGEPNETVNRADAEVDRVHSEIQVLEAERMKGNERAHESTRQPQGSSNPYVNTRPVPIRKTLPRLFERQVTFHEPHPTPIGQVMGKLSQVAGLQVGFEYDLVDSGARSGNIRDQRREDSAGRDVSVVDLDELAGARSEGGELMHDVKVAVSHQGRVRDVLDAAANALQANWRYDEGAQRVVFYRYVTKTMRIAMTPGSIRNDVNIETRSEQSRTGGAESNLRLEGDSSVWESVEAALETMTSSRGAFSVTDTTGTVTIRDVPDVVDRVAEYIENLNETFQRQVSVDVQVFRVEASQEDLRGVNWSALFDTPNIGLEVSSPGGGVGDLNPGTARLSIPEGAGTLSRFVGSEGFIQSLSRIGKTSSVTSTTLQTVNNQPAPVRIGQTIAYLESVSQTDTANVGSSTTLTPGEIDVGFSMQLLPHVQDNGRDILMQVMLTLSTLDRIEEFESGGQRIQLPEVSSRDFVQRTWLQSGEALVLAGFESIDANLSRQGLIDADQWALGGNRAADNRKESLVIVLTPTVTSIRDRF